MAGSWDQSRVAMSMALDTMGQHPHALSHTLAIPGAAGCVDDRALAALARFAESVTPGATLVLAFGAQPDPNADFESAHAMLCENRGLAPFGCHELPERAAYADSADLFEAAQLALARSMARLQ